MPILRDFPTPRSAALRSVACSLGLCGLLACAGPNLWTDLTSVSHGKTNRGRVRKPAKIPMRGAGYVVPERWRKRGFHYGVDELVAAVQRAAGRVHAHDRRSKLGIADFSHRRGGRSPWHKSHHSGRDVDLLFYTTDEKGKPLPPPVDDMIKFDGDGNPFVSPRRKDPYNEVDWERRRFDARRNWQFVEALLTDPSIRVQWVFVSTGLQTRMLRYARRKKRPEWIMQYAKTVMSQPGDSAPHDDHFHIRIYCTRSDRFHGCEDRGPVWQHEKKSFKYYGPERYDPVLWRVLLVAPRPLL